MAPSDNSFTDNLSAVDRIYGTHAQVETDKDGNTKHIDVANKGGKGKPVDLENVGVPTEDQPSPEASAPTSPPEANPDVDPPTDPLVGGAGVDEDGELQA